MLIREVIPQLQFRRAHVKRRQTDAISLHHLHSETATPQQVHSWHQNPPNNWPGNGYHFQVDLNGTIWRIRPTDVEGIHTLRHNATTIGVGCQGRYHDHRREMPQAQFDAIVWLIRHIRNIYGDIPVKGHREFSGNATVCPGQFFPLEQIRAAADAPPITEKEDDEVTPEQFNQMMDEWMRANSILPESPWSVDGGHFEAATKSRVLDGTAPRGFVTREQLAAVMGRLGLLGK